MNAGRVVARNIRRMRVLNGLPQEALADEAQIDRTYVSQLERELKNPTVSLLEKVASALGCDIRDFFDPEAVARPPKALPGGRRPKNKGGVGSPMYKQGKK
jgi:transcriptional regulator with XRE-family HTH domain